MAKKKATRKNGDGARTPPVPEAARRRTRWPLVAAVATVAVAASIALLAWRFASHPAGGAFARTRNQNVLLITIDTWRADALGASGAGKVATPNLDRLAALGVRFDFAHAQAVVTLPSHSSILTGRYPYQHGVHDNAGFRVPPSEPTLGAMLRPLGFATGAFIGSIALDSRFGLNNGFDVYDEHYGKGNLNSGFTMAERRADAVVTAATAWLAQQRGPWFAWVHVFDPHAPYIPPPPFDAQYADRPYYGEVAYTDFALRPLLDAARDPSGRPTLVVVTGDHGEGLGDHGEMTHGLFAYEATLHVPLIMASISRDTPAWTGGEPGSASPQPGRVSHVEARHVDVVPTILDALGVPAPAALAGRTLLPGSPGADSGERPSYFEALSASFNRGWAPLTGVLADRQKMISLPLPELYDLRKDPKESANLIDRDGERRRVLEARLRQFESSGPAARVSESGDARAQLQALGYVTGSAPRKERYTENDDPKRLIVLDQQMRRAIDLYERKRPQEAIPIYRQLIAERPTMEVSYSQLAMLLWDLGQPAEAIATLRQAVRAGADSVPIRTTLGTYLAESGDLKAALPLLREVTAGPSADTDALNALGIAEGRAGQTREAVATFERILRTDPFNEMAIENLGSIALAERRWEDARRWFSQALQADPGSTQAHNGLGVVEMKAGNRRAAIEHWQQAVARDPENFDALYNVATELVNDGRPGEARRYLEQFVRTAPPAFYANDITRVRNLLQRVGK